ncbi:uncharacterized protein LOC118448265 isoform X1 [Vespa mandarinia]|uniref:uncharacterized protein LOC118448265 isoform X1 n=1 Tax=Vespa mandarinia TaxID=7446 RepID=UPI0016117976|nr:uncharacterized protein LOC118448265 isoform X1 [Vespa mandarinia]
MITKYDNHTSANDDVDNYIKYANLTTEPNRWILEPLGVWPLKRANIEVSWKDNFLRRGKNVFYYFLMFFVFVPCVPYAIFEIESVYYKLKLIGPMSFCVMGFVKYTILNIREKDIRCCVESIEMDWKRITHFEDERIMMDKVYTGRRLVTLCLILTYGAAGFFHIVSPLMSGKVFASAINVTYMPAPFPVTSLLMDIRYSPANEIFIFIQCLYGFMAHSIEAGTCSLTAVFTMHACGQLQVLINWLEHLLDGREGMCSNVDERMASIIQQHVRTLKFCFYSFISRTESLLNEVSLIEVLGCTLNICFLGYYCLIEGNMSERIGCITYGIILSSMTFNIFILCYIGELLIEQCQILGERTYAIDWYRLAGKKSQPLILLIAMTRTTTKLTAGHFMELSLSSFSDVKDTYDKLRLTGPLSFCLMALIKYCALTVRENDIRRCFDYIEWDWKKVKHIKDLQIMKANANFGRRIVIVCATFMYSSAAFYYIAVPFARGMITEEDSNITYRPLVYPVAKIIVDARRSPINEIFFGIQCISGFLAHSITAAACGLAATFAMHACGQLEMIISYLENLVNGHENSCDTVEERFTDIVQRHVRALKFISLTEEVLNEISLVEVVGCTLNICLLGYYCITGWQYNETMGRLTYIILFISVTFNIFIFCYIGEILADQCQKVGERSYMIDWYRLPWKDVRGLVLILAMSNMPNNLTAGYLIELSLASFGDVIKSSLAYLNMLRTLTE